MKMIQRIEFKNFLWTPERFVDFSEKNDSILIVGENAKGKTTIMRAVYFCLTGEDAFFGSTNLDSVIMDGTDEMSIKMEILSSDKTSLFFIDLSKKIGKSLKIKIYENGELLNTSDLITDAKEILTSLFGNPLSIKNTYFMFSSSDDDFVNATNSRRLEIITKSSNIFTEYEMISESAKTMVNRKADEKIRLQGEYDNENERITSVNQSISEMEIKLSSLLGNEISDDAFGQAIEKSEAYQENMKRAIALMDEAGKIERDINSVQSIDVPALKEKMAMDDQAVEHNKALNEKSTNIRNELSNVMKDKESVFKELSSKKESKARVESTISSLSKQMVVISDEEFAIRYSDDVDLNSVSAELRDRKSWIDALKADWVKYNTQIESKQSEINKTKELFQHSRECPVCHSGLTEAMLEAYVDKIQGEIDVITEQRNKLRIDYKQANDEYSAVESSYNATIKVRENIRLENEINLNNNKLAEFDLTGLQEALLKYEDYISKLEEDIKNVESGKKQTLSSYDKNDIRSKIETASNVDAKVARLWEVKTLIANFGYDKSQYDLNIDLSNEKNSSDGLKFMYGQYNNMKKSLIDSSDKMNVIVRDIELVKKDIEQYDNLRNYFGKNGIQKEQIEHILQSVEMETNGMVNKFFDNIGVRFTYDGNGIGLEIIRQSVSDYGIEYKPDVIKNFSDAQQEVLKTLLKLSFSKVLQYLNGTPLNIIFLNETFNTLSVNKEEELVNILNYFEEEYQVFFITHNQSLISKYDSNSIVKL